jgi:hypothetical protein
LLPRACLPRKSVARVSLSRQITNFGLLYANLLRAFRRSPTVVGRARESEAPPQGKNLGPTYRSKTASKLSRNGLAVSNW